MGGWTLTPCKEVNGCGWGGASEYTHEPHSPRTSGSLESCSYPESAVLCGAHSQVYPEGGSKEIKEESCHHSRQALTAIECIPYRRECFCAISNSSLSHTALLS